MPVQVLWRSCFGFLFFWCLRRFCDSNLHKTCTGIKKTKKNKPLDAQNLHRHQKNKQKNKNLSIYSGLGVYRLQNFGYFSFFDACAGFVKIMLWFFWFFWCLCRFCDSNLHKTCTGIKKNKKNKPLDAQNLHRHQKKQKKQNLSIYSGLGVQNFCYFGFFDACAGFVMIMLWFF